MFGWLDEIRQRWRERRERLREQNRTARDDGSGSSFHDDHAYATTASYGSAFGETRASPPESSWSGSDSGSTSSSDSGSSSSSSDSGSSSSGSSDS